MRSNRAFVPSALGGLTRLEDRVVLTAGVSFINGAAVLTTHALQQTQGQLYQAFVRFASHGQNGLQLQYDMSKAISRIPYHKVDGLDAGIAGLVTSMQADMASGVPGAVRNAYQTALTALNDQIQARVTSGTVLRR